MQEDENYFLYIFSLNFSKLRMHASWHLPESRAVAYDDLHLRMNARQFQVHCFSISRLPRFSYF